MSVICHLSMECSLVCLVSHVYITAQSGEQRQTRARAILAEAHKNSKALCYGSIKIPVLTNKQCIIEREFEGERVLVAINADDQPFTAHFDAGCGQAEELLTGTIHDFGGGSELKPYSVEFWKMER